MWSGVQETNRLKLGGGKERKKGWSGRERRKRREERVYDEDELRWAKPIRPLFACGRRRLGCPSVLCPYCMLYVCTRYPYSVLPAPGALAVL